MNKLIGFLFLALCSMLGLELDGASTESPTADALYVHGDEADVLLADDEALPNLWGAHADTEPLVAPLDTEPLIAHVDTEPLVEPSDVDLLDDALVDALYADDAALGELFAVSPKNGDPRAESPAKPLATSPTSSADAFAGSGAHADDDRSRIASPVTSRTTVKRARRAARRPTPSTSESVDEEEDSDYVDVDNDSDYEDTGWKCRRAKLAAKPRPTAKKSRAVAVKPQATVKRARLAIKNSFPKPQDLLKTCSAAGVSSAHLVLPAGRELHAAAYETYEVDGASEDAQMHKLFALAKTGNVHDVRQALDSIYEQQGRDEGVFVDSIVSGRIEGSSLLHYAVSNVAGDGVAIVDEIMRRLDKYSEQKKQFISACDNDGYNVLFLALQLDSEEMLQTVLNYVINDPAIPNNERLLLLYANPKMGGVEQEISLFYLAAWRGFHKKISLIMGILADRVVAPKLAELLFKPTITGTTVLHCAVKSTDSQTVAFLINYLKAARTMGFVSDEKYAEIINYEVTTSRKTALDYAKKQNDPAMIKLLSDAGAGARRNGQGLLSV